MGPTASGKTDLAVSLVREFPCEIISVDSAMVYRGMDIGTAKPDDRILAQAPHRLINILDPSDAYSVADFRQDALREMAQITSAGKVPLLVGGTMLYYRSLLRGLSDLPSANEAIRRKIEQEASEQGWNAMHHRLQEIDPQSAARIHPNDPQRIQRALEVYELTGMSLSEHFQRQTPQDFGYQVEKLAVTPTDRSVLHARIEQRFHKMLELGFVSEVEALYAREDMHTDLPSMRSIGYRQVLKYLMGDYTYIEMIEKGIVVTRQLAKRQLTWLRSEKSVEVFDSLDKLLFEKIKKQVGYLTGQ